MDQKPPNPDSYLWGELDFGRLMALQAASESRFYSVLNEDNGIGMVYGGQMLAQAVLAGARTLPAVRAARHVQLSFARPGKVGEALAYAVEPVLDGRRASMRLIRIEQGDKILATANLGFQDPEPGLEQGESMPDCESPEALVDVRELVAATPELQRGYGLASIARKRGIEFRMIHPETYATRRAAAPRFRYWMRLRRPIGDDPLLHQAAGLYLSDWAMAFAPLLPRLPMAEAQCIAISTLSHDAWFYRPFRADDWLLMDVEGHALASGRGLALARIHARGGPVVAVMTQELLYPFAERLAS